MSIHFLSFCSITFILLHQNLYLCQSELNILSWFFKYMFCACAFLVFLFRLFKKVFSLKREHLTLENPSIKTYAKWYKSAIKNDNSFWVLYGSWNKDLIRDKVAYNNIVLWKYQLEAGVQLIHTIFILNQPYQFRSRRNNNCLCNGWNIAN